MNRYADFTAAPPSYSLTGPTEVMSNGVRGDRNHISAGIERIARHRRSRRLPAFLFASTALIAALAAGAKPAAAQLSAPPVKAGQATVTSPAANKTVINQTTSKAILEWNVFSIPAGSSVQFVQPGAGSIALNRVTGTSVTNIQGQLTANGQVWIVNPNGVFFGPGAQVNVAGLIATTADIQNSDFLSGNYKFGIGSSNPNASIVNQGTIQASAGGAVLAGAQVTNQGLIIATMGTIALGAGKTFAVDFQGDKLIQFQVTSPTGQAPADGSALVTNSGTLSAQGGTVLLTARGAKGVIDNVINTSGIVEAISAKLVNGEIVLDGGDVGTVTVSGKLDASAKSAGGTGGAVKVLGNQVTLAAGATLDVSGDAGGGTALVGGNFHGSGPEQNAATTTVSAGATIDASARSRGNGGKIAVWADTATSFSGTILATGGSLSGNGGYVETSGKQTLSVGKSAKVDTSAKQGNAGAWLLDPADAIIGTGGGEIDPGAITNALASGEVIIETGKIAGGANGDITVDASTGNTLVYSSPNQLSLLAVGNIIANAPIQNGGGGTINLVAGWSLGAGLGAGTSSGVFQPGDMLSPSATTGTFAPGSLTAADFGLGGGSITFSSSLGSTGGNVDLFGANVSVSGPISTAGTPGTSTANGGSVLIMASGSVHLAGVTTSGANQTNATQVAGSGGSVSIYGSTVTIAGNITATGGSGILSSNGGDGGALLIAATGAAAVGAGGNQTSIRAAGGSAASGRGGAGGAISISGATVTTAGSLNNVGGNAVGGGGSGSAITLTALSGSVSIGRDNTGVSVLTRGGQGVSGNAGNGGAIFISGDSVSTAGGMFSRGGDVVLSASGGRGGDAAPLTILSSGDIMLGLDATQASISARGGLSSGVGGGGNAAPVTITSTRGSITLAGAISDRGGDAGVLGSGGAGGIVAVSAPSGTLTIGTAASFLTSNSFAVAVKGGDATSGNGGNAGTALLSAGGAISVAIGTLGLTDDVALTARGGDSSVTGSGGHGGVISIVAGGAVLIAAAPNNEAVLARGGLAQAGAGGDAGAIAITGTSVLVAGAVSAAGGDALLGPAGTTTGRNGGDAGPISITATSGDIVILDSLSTPVFLGTTLTTYTAISARGGSTDGTANAGNGAPVVLSAASGAITVGTALPSGTPIPAQQMFDGAILTQGGDNVSTLGGNGGNAGSVSVVASGNVAIGTINADEAAGINSMIVARGGTAAAGQGGTARNVSIRGSSLTIAGVDAQGGASSAAGTGGSAGIITLTTAGGSGTVTLLAYTPASGGGPSVNAGGGFAGATQNGTGGSIEIDGSVIVAQTPTLTNSAQIPTLALSAAGIALGTVSTGSDAVTVIADNVALNGAWAGTGARTIAPFSPISIGLAGAPGAFQLTNLELSFLANGNTAPVTIGSTTAGAVTAKSFTFNAPLTIIGSAIQLKGLLSKARGALSLLAFNGTTAGAIKGSVSLAPGTGRLTVEASSLALDQSIINGFSGKAAAQWVTLTGTIGPGPYTVNNGTVTP